MKKENDDSEVLSLLNRKDPALFIEIGKNCKKGRFGERVGVQFWYFKLAMYVIYPSEFVKYAARWISEVQK